MMGRRETVRTGPRGKFGEQYPGTAAAAAVFGNYSSRMRSDDDRKPENITSSLETTRKQTVSSMAAGVPITVLSMGATRKTDCCCRLAPGTRYADLYQYMVFPGYWVRTTELLYRTRSIGE